jgi:hypothetical protein
MPGTSIVAMEEEMSGKRQSAYSPLRHEDRGSRSRGEPSSIPAGSTTGSIVRRPKKRYLLALAGFMMLTIFLLSATGNGTLMVQQASSKFSASYRSEASPVDAMALIALSKVTQSPALEIVVDSIRTTGGWTGPIYIFTDMPLLCSNKKAMDRLNVEVVRRDSAEGEGVGKEEALPRSGAEICRSVALSKCGLLDLLPSSIKSVLYIDSDIIVTQPLGPFLSNLGDVLREDKAEVGLFMDAGAHTFGICADCDTWHGGVIGMRRGQSEACLSAWCDQIKAKGCPDQAAMDAVIEQGHCQGIGELDSTHIKFMKDYFKLGTRTFSHFTGLFSPGISLLESFVYRNAIGADRFESIMAAKTGAQVGESDLSKSNC